MGYPAQLELEADTGIANWRPLVHWLLGIPHMAIAYVLTQVASIVAVISWFAIVFTGALPGGLANFQCLVIRYNARAYSYILWLREPYPPFALDTTPEDPGGDPLRVDLQPALENRDRLTVGLRFIWAIPALLVAMVLSVAVMVVSLVSFFAVLFTGQYPAGMRDFVVRCGRFWVRASAYWYLLTDRYPPLALE